jgi:hypothetical protein
MRDLGIIIKQGLTNSEYELHGQWRKPEEV